MNNNSIFPFYKNTYYVISKTIIYKSSLLLSTDIKPDLISAATTIEKGFFFYISYHTIYYIFLELNDFSLTKAKRENWTKTTTNNRRSKKKVIMMSIRLLTIPLVHNTICNINILIFIFVHILFSEWQTWDLFSSDNNVTK